MYVPVTLQCAHAHLMYVFAQTYCLQALTLGKIMATGLGEDSSRSTSTGSSSQVHRS